MAAGFALPRRNRRRARRNATSRAIGVNDSTRTCPSAERAPRSAITRACRSMTPRVCAPTRGMRRSGRCRSGSASRTRPTTGRAVRRRCASAAPSIPISQDVIVVGHHRHVDAAAPQDLHGRPPAPVAECAAQLAGIFDGRVGRRHAQGDDDAPEGRLGAAQRLAAQRQSDARRVLHSQRELPDARHRRDGSRLSDRAARAHVGLGARHGVAVEPVLVHPRNRDRAAARRGAAPLAGHELVPRGVSAAPWAAGRGGARRRADDVPRVRPRAPARSSKVQRGESTGPEPSARQPSPWLLACARSPSPCSRKPSSRFCRRKATCS